MYSHTERFYTLPGGGVHVHKREHIDHAALREVDEETGYDARLTHYLGVIEEHRGFRNHLERSHCFLAEVIGAPQEPMQTMYEQFMRFECQWFSYVDALRRLQANERHSTCVWDVTFRFIAKREIAILERARTFIERPLCPA